MQFIHTYTWITVTLLICWKPFLLPHLPKAFCFSWHFSCFLPVQSEVQNPMLRISEDAVNQFPFSLLDIATFNLIPQWNSWTSTIIYISQHSSTTNYIIHFTNKHIFYNKTINLCSTTFGHQTTLSSCSQPLTYPCRLIWNQNIHHQTERWKKNFKALIYNIFQIIVATGISYESEIQHP